MVSQHTYRVFNIGSGEGTDIRQLEAVMLTIRFRFLNWCWQLGSSQQSFLVLDIRTRIRGSCYMVSPTDRQGVDSVLYSNRTLYWQLGSSEDSSAITAGWEIEESVWFPPNRQRSNCTQSRSNRRERSYSRSYVLMAIWFIRKFVNHNVWTGCRGEVVWFPPPCLGAAWETRSTSR